MPSIQNDKHIQETQFESKSEDITITAKWLPESINEINEQPQYKSVKPNLILDPLTRAMRERKQTNRRARSAAVAAVETAQTTL